MVEQIRSWIDSIFAPLHAPLDLAIQKLRETQMITAQGLDVGSYLRVFGDMPTPWQMVIMSLMLSMVAIGGVFIFRSIVRVYYAKKEGVKWW